MKRRNINFEKKRCPYKKGTISFLKRGSSTVEAAFLFPMIMAIIILFLYLSFFMYNRLIVSEAAYLAALRGSREEWKTAMESYGLAREGCDELLKDSLIFTKNYERQVEVKGKRVMVTLQITQQIPLKGMTAVFTGNKDPVFVTTKGAIKQNPYQYMRECSRARHEKEKSQEERK